MKNKMIALSLLLLFCISTIGTASAEKTEERWYELQIHIKHGTNVVGNELTWKTTEGPFYPIIYSYYPEPDDPRLQYVISSAGPSDYGIYKLNGTLVTRGLAPHVDGGITTLVFHPKDVEPGDYFLKVKYNNRTDYYRGEKKEYRIHLLGAERWVFLHIKP